MNTTINPDMTPLDQITSADELRSGGKAYNCARLRQAGFPVPDGLVVPTTASDVDLALLTDHPWFNKVPPDTLFAVRSSGIGEDGAGQSFAGIHETRLNVPRADIADAVVACRASARSPQALAYRRAKGMTTDAIQAAVLIQRMIQPIAAGVAFTINPVTGADDELVVNSSWGLGEALVSGQIDPDEFTIRKRDRALLWSRVGDKGRTGEGSNASLTPFQIRELAELAIRIERHYGTPQDVEWCHDGSRFWVVQSRPVTASGERSTETEWTRANLAEVLPDLTSPQALAAFEDLLNRAERQYMGKLMAPDAALGPMVKSFYGRLYFNLSQLRRACAMGGVAPAMMLRSMGHAAAIEPADERLQPASMRERLSAVPDFVRIMLRHLRAARIVRGHAETTRRYLAQLSAVDPRTLSDEELWSVIEQWLRDAPDAMQTVLLLGGVLFHEGPLRKMCEKLGVSFERLVYPQLATGERSVSAQQAFDLVSLADAARREPAAMRYVASGPLEIAPLRSALRDTAFLRELDRFLANYGHRGRYESDWALPRYSEDPTPVLLAIRAHLQAPLETAASETSARQAREAADAWTAFERRLTRWQRWTALPRVRRSIRKIKQYYVWREEVRSDLVRILAMLRTRHLVLAQRFVERKWLDNRDQYFVLHLEEIGSVIRRAADPGVLRATVAARAAEMERYRSLSMPLLMRESELPQLIRTASVTGVSADDSRLTGHPVSGGCIEAEVVVVNDPGDFERMKKGAILVARATDPSWTPLFTLASGVIVEVGGVLSHASTVAREYGLPALANVKHATKRLRTGERVRLDAINGLVERLDHHARRVD